MSAPLIEKACAKINLTLRVLGRRADGYHTLESLMAFAALGDTLTLRPASSVGLDITGPFAAACGARAENLVLRAVSALDAHAGAVKTGHFLLEKTLPVSAGIGGGSADAGAALRLLARLNDLPLDDPRLAKAALTVGADVPVCLDARARIVRGIGEQLSAPLALPPLPALLVNPGVPLATREVFAAYTEGDASTGELEKIPYEADALIDMLSRHDNDLTQAAVACEPVVAELLAALRVLPGMRLARMSGSGPTSFALFSTLAEATAAERRLALEHENWWVRATIIA